MINQHSMFLLGFFRFSGGRRGKERRGEERERGGRRGGRRGTPEESREEKEGGEEKKGAKVTEDLISVDHVRKIINKIRSK